MAEARIRLSLRDQVSAKLERINKRFEPLNRKLDVTSRRFARLRRSTMLSTKALQGLGRRLQGVGRTLTTFVSLPATIGAGFAVKEFMEFESGLIGIQKTTDLTDEKIKQLGLRFQDISTTVPLTTESLNKFAQIAGQTGVRSTKDLEKFAVAIGKLETASDIAGEEGASSIAKLLKLTKTAATDVDKFTNVFVALGNAFPPFESDILAVANEVGKTSTIVGFTADQVLGLSTAFAEFKVQPRAAASSLIQLGKAFQELDVNSGLFKKFGELTGRTTKQLADDVDNNLNNVVLDFVQVLSKLKPRDQNEALKQFGLNSLEVTKSILPLANNIEELDKILKASGEAFTNTDAVQKEFENRNKSLSAALLLLRNKFRALQQVIGEKLAPAVRVLGVIFGSIADFFRNNPAFANIIVVFGVLAAVIGPVLLLLGTLLAILPAIAAGWAFVTSASLAALLPVLVPIAAVVAGIVALVSVIAILVTHWESIKGVMIRVWRSPLGFLFKWFTPLGLFLNFAEMIIDNWKPIAGFFESLWDGIAGTFKEAVKIIENLGITGLVESLIGGIDFLTGGNIAAGARGELDQNPDDTIAEGGAAAINKSRAAGIINRSGKVGQNNTVQTNNAQVTVDFKGLPSGAEVKSKGGRGTLNLATGAAGVNF